MFYQRNNYTFKKMLAFLLALQMTITPCIANNGFTAITVFAQSQKRFNAGNTRDYASPSTATISTAKKERQETPVLREIQADTIQPESPVEGMEITNQALAENLLISREEGQLFVSQLSATGGYNSTAGSRNTASLLLYDSGIDGDFDLHATVSISEFTRTETAYGLYVGAFTGIEAMSEFASLGFRGNQGIRGYGSNTANTFGTLSSNKQLVLDQEYQVTFSRIAGDYWVKLESEGEVLLESDLDVYTDGGLEEGLDVYPGFSFIGVKAEISDLTLESDGMMLIDSSEWTGGYQPDRADWEDVEAPLLGTPSIALNGSTIKVPWTMEMGMDGADYIKCMMKDEWNQIVETQTSAQSGNSGTFSFVPTASGTYRFTAEAGRNQELETKVSNEQIYQDFLLALQTPIVRAVSAGDHKMKVIWGAVDEAESYQVFYRAESDSVFVPVNLAQESIVDQNEFFVLIPDLVVGTRYYFEVVASALGQESSAPGSCNAVLSQFAERDWQFAWFGTSTNQANNQCSGNIDDGLVLESTNNKGKFTGDGYDGLAFYYTKVDPTTENFELQGTFTVDSLTLSNGQEGFALLVRDSIGTHGNNSSAYYTNSVAVMGSKVEYENNDGEKVTLRLGIGSRVVKGIYDTIAAPSAGSFSSTMKTLDTTIQAPGEGHFVETNHSYKFILKKTNTGYHMIYEKPDGSQTEEIFYDAEELMNIDSDYIYVGFAAARNCKVSISDISFTVSNPLTDPPAVARPITLVDPAYGIVSPKTSGSAEYALIYSGNADGILTIKDQNGTAIVSDLTVAANEKISRDIILAKGQNQFTVSMTPDTNYYPGEYQKLSSYETKTFTTTVNYDSFGYPGQTIVVSVDGSPSGTGSSQKPLDIKTAINYVQPGQTILLKPGIYNISDGLKIPRGINGTPDQMIYLVSDPSSDERAVIDFMRTGTGFEIWGNYWYIRGLDVRHSTNMSKGIQLAGSHNTIDSLNIYDNGNTGLQISGLSSESIDMWPSNNLILNSTSYNNSDIGMGDADGFAAKLTCGTNNVFRGCISYNNADDGWDFFAKVATGSIGAVTIEDCVAFRNGYLLNGTDAGNGNGFKMGGSALSGHHVLKNGISFENKAKGIDSNSCPDIEIYDSTSFNNGSYNVALYSNIGVPTGFAADGILSYKTESGIEEQLKLNGQSPLFSLNNYFFNGNYSANIAGDQLSEDWFVSLDTSVTPTRFADGSINMHGLLELTGLAPSDSGARLNPTPSPEIFIPEEINDVDTAKPSRGKTGGGSGGSTVSKKVVSAKYYPASSGDDGVWHQNEQGWYLMNPDGSYAKNEWKIIKGKWYFFNVQGYMVTGWHMLDQNQWFFMNSDGVMMTGWVLEKEKWYYLKADGAMNKDTLTINDITYQFSENGDCLNP